MAVGGSFLSRSVMPAFAKSGKSLDRRRQERSSHCNCESAVEVGKIIRGRTGCCVIGQQRARGKLLVAQTSTRPALSALAPHSMRPGSGSRNLQTLTRLVKGVDTPCSGAKPLDEGSTPFCIALNKLVVHGKALFAQAVTSRCHYLPL